MENSLRWLVVLEVIIARNHQSSFFQNGCKHFDEVTDEEINYCFKENAYIFQIITYVIILKQYYSPQAQWISVIKTFTLSWFLFTGIHLTYGE